jgi:hypothetical protein
LSAPYLEEMEDEFTKGTRTLAEVADAIGIEFESAALTFNNGICKGYWSVVKGKHNWDEKRNEEPSEAEVLKFMQDYRDCAAPDEFSDVKHALTLFIKGRA